ncbi:MAG: thioredoxin domain-containing protein, partial [Acidobacteriota bacterium]|nr:thioredoxin domain-containing protein [Acidobacteriota bacterium]
LDVGATWCSTCDRMDRESYTRPEIAEYINANFVAVKLDYDARPRLTAKLERAHALKNLPAGIPLTGFLTPCGKLYLGGTYFPPQAEGEKPGFAATLQQAAGLYRTERAQVEQDGFDLKLKEEFGEEKTHSGAGPGSSGGCGKK